MAKATEGGTVLAPDKSPSSAGAGAGAAGAATGSAAGGAPGATNGDWRAALPEEIRADANLANLKDVADLARAHISGQKMLGSRVPIPGPDAKDADWNELWTKLGRPVDPKGYKLPAGVQFDEDSQPRLQAFMGKMHGAGLTQKQVEAAIGWYAETEAARVAEELKADEAEHQAAVAALKTEWGAEYDAKVSLAKQAVVAFGGEALAKWMNETGLGDDPVLIRTFAAAGKLVTEDSLRGKGGVTTTNPQAEAEAAIKQKELDKDFMDALRDRANPRHEAALQEWKRLMKAAYPGEVSI